MHFIKKLYGRLISQRWEIGFVKKGMDGVFSDHPEYIWVNNPFKDRWFADPFILDVTDDFIYLLVEEFRYATKKGRIALLTIEKKNYSIVDLKILLEEQYHLSFPNILRKDGRIFVYPENHGCGKLNLYELIGLDRDNPRLVYKKMLCDTPLTDAVLTDIFGSTQIYSTQMPDPNGCVLNVFAHDKRNEFIPTNSIVFDDKHARMAGQFFEYNHEIYRPAQDCNKVYGGGLVIEKCIKQDKDVPSFMIVNTLRSNHPKLREGMHTLNMYKGFVVVDVIGYNYGVFGKYLHKFTHHVLSASK